MKVALNDTEIRQIMARRNQTHTQVARILRTSRSYWSQLLSGERNPGPLMRDKIQRIFRGYAWGRIFLIAEVE